MKKVLAESFQRVKTELPWLASDFGKVFSPKIRKEHGIPSEALLVQISSNGFVVLHHEAGLKWSVSVFYGNEYHLAFRQRLTVPRAEFAVFEFLLGQIVEWMEYSVRVLVTNFPEKAAEAKELKKFLVATKKILAEEEAIERTPAVYKI
jgi:hypothetical protein